MPTWPSGLPQGLLLGLTRQRQDAAVRFQPDLGAPITRRRGTAAPFALTGDLVLTADQFRALDAFFKDDLVEGTLSFTWKDPATGSSATLVFQGPYGATLMTPDTWRVSLALLILP